MPNREALTNLRRVVAAAPEERFDMRDVVCGTSRCALGWCFLDPWFMEHHLGGLTVYDIDFYKAGEIFGLGYDDRRALFAGSAMLSMRPDVVSRQEVLENIDRLLAGELAQTYRALR